MNVRSILIIVGLLAGAGATYALDVAELSSALVSLAAGLLLPQLKLFLAPGEDRK